MNAYDIDIFKDFNEENILSYSCEDINFLTEQIITYIGNKRNLLDLIRTGLFEVQKRLNEKKLSILDGFSGSGVVSRFFKAYASILYVNDIEFYSTIINKCYLSNKTDINIKELTETVSYINANKYKDVGGIISELYAPQRDNEIRDGERVFFTSLNAKIIDSIRSQVEFLDNNYLYIAPLLYEASVKNNTCGIFKGFYKDKDGRGRFGGADQNCLRRITSEISLRVPIFSINECPVRVTQKDINELIKDMEEVDVAYFDPPYNSHPYGSNYFMLNLICTNKRPLNISKVSGIPQEWNRSDYNTKSALMSINSLLLDVKAKFVLLSYNNEGIISFEEMYNILSSHGKLVFFEQGYNAFRGSRNLRNRSKKVQEYLFLLEK